MPRALDAAQVSSKSDHAKALDSGHIGFTHEKGDDKPAIRKTNGRW
jgi:hypothetical protein